MNPDYNRVIPRDLFNEAKLLKCIGKLVLSIHDGLGINNMTFEHEGDPFIIGLHDEGYLSVTNIRFEMNGQRMFFQSQYNSKNQYPLFCRYDYCDYLVFEETGEYSEEFKQLCETLS